MLLPPYLGSRPGAEEPVPQREALRKVNVGPYVVALVVRRAQLHLQRVEAVKRARLWAGVDAGYDWCLGAPGPLPLSVRSGPDPGGGRPRGTSLRAAGCGLARRYGAALRRGATARRYGAALRRGASQDTAKAALWACGRHVERAREPRRRSEVAAAILDARVAVELLEKQVRLADVVPCYGGANS